MELFISVLLGLWISISGAVALWWVNKEFSSHKKTDDKRDRT